MKRTLRNFPGGFPDIKIENTAPKSCESYGSCQSYNEKAGELPNKGGVKWLLDS